MKNAKLIYLILIAALSFLQFNGCTALGLLIGLNSDASHVTEFKQTNLEIHDFDPGTLIEVSLANGDTISGKFLGLDSVAADEYAARYENFRQSAWSELKLPQLYDSISINQNNKYSYIFLGFDYGYMKVKRIKFNSVAKIDLKKINHICNSKNNCIEGKNLERIMAKGDMPLLSDLVINTENTEVNIPSMDLVQGKVTGNHYGWLYGLSAGIMVDVAFVIFVIIPNTDFTGMGGWGK